MKEITVTYHITDNQANQLGELLLYWQQYANEEGNHPFAKWTIVDLFQSIMFAGSINDIEKKIESEKFRQDSLAGKLEDWP